MSVLICRQIHCLLHNIFWLTIQRSYKLRITGAFANYLCGNLLVIGVCPAQKDNNVWSTSMHIYNCGLACNATLKLNSGWRFVGGTLCICNSPRANIDDMCTRATYVDMEYYISMRYLTILLMCQRIYRVDLSLNEHILPMHWDCQAVYPLFVTLQQHYM